MTGGITNHPNDESIATFRRGMTTGAEAERISAHLAACGDCAQTARALDLVLLGLDEEFTAHVPAESLVAFGSQVPLEAGVTGQLEWTTEKIESHLAYCSQCRDELDLLHTIDAAQVRPHDSQIPKRHSWRRLLRPRIVVPLAAAAIAVFLVVQFQGGPDRAPWQTVDPAVDKGKLVASSTRSLGDAQNKTYASAIDAALASYRSVLQFNNGDFQFVVPPSADMTGDTLRVRLVGTDGRIVDELRGLLPVGLDAVQDSVQIWILTLPSRRLQRMPVQSHDERIDWRLANGEMGCVTWTYRSDSGYFATPSVTFGNRH